MLGRRRDRVYDARMADEDEEAPRLDEPAPSEDVAREGAPAPAEPSEHASAAVPTDEGPDEPILDLADVMPWQAGSAMAEYEAMRRPFEEALRAARGYALSDVGRLGSLSSIYARSDPMRDLIEGRMGALTRAELDRVTSAAAGLPTTVAAALEQHRSMTGALGGMASASTSAALAEVHRASTVAGIMRRQNWSRYIEQSTVAGVMRSLGMGTVGEELRRLASGAALIGGGAVAAAAAHQPSTVAAMMAREAALSATSLKFATFAGGLEVLGPRASTTLAAYEALMGGWRTRSDLPASFWRDREARRRAYREADVDPGLVETEAPALVEVLIDSGVVEQDEDRGRKVAIVRAGPIDVRVSASRPRLGAYRAISAFEVALRGFAAARIEASETEAGGSPRGWFRRRMPGEVLKRVRDRREAARAAGEEPARQIDYVDLGDFIAIAEQKPNRPVFERAFGSLEGFKVDMMRLNAIRRPTAHPRPIDPVQLAEAVLTISRLTSAMERDGGWDPVWDDKEG